MKRVPGGVVLLASKSRSLGIDRRGLALADPKHPIRRLKAPAREADVQVALTHVLDTDIRIEALRRRSEPLLGHLREHSPEAIAVFVITEAEL